MLGFFLLCQLNPGNGKRSVKRQELISKSSCLQSREETTEKPAEEVTDRAMVWKGSKSLSPAMGIWYILTHKRKHPSLVLSADTSQQSILLPKTKPLSVTVAPVYEPSSCFHLAYLKMRCNKNVDVLRARDWLDSSHCHRNCPPSPFTGFLRHKAISQGHGNNDTEIQSVEIKHTKLTLITAKLCHLSESSSLLFKTIQ